MPPKKTHQKVVIKLNAFIKIEGLSKYRIEKGMSTCHVIFKKVEFN
jgi:hypothetical protein